MANRATALFARAQEEPEKAAILFDGGVYSFARLAEHVRIAAAGFAKRGIGKGSHVGIMIKGSPQFIIAQQALFALGAAITPINVQYRLDEVRHAVSCCCLSFIVTTGEFLTELADVGCTLVSMDEIDGQATDDARLSLASVADDDPVMLLLTSATTGKAKGVILTAGNLVANYDQTPGWLGLDHDSVILCALPLYNTFGLNQCINAMLATGATLVLMPRFDAERCIDMIAAHRCTFLPAVPTMLQKIVDHPRASKETLGSLSLIMTGGAPVPGALLRRLIAVAPHVKVLTGYGLTEATALATLTEVRLGADGEIEKDRTIGRVLDGMELAILRDDGTLASVGETGEIILRGPNVMAGYFQAQEDTAVALQGGWLRTGDIGHLDEDGYAFIVDRKKDVIIRGGQNIYPADIEEVIYQVDGVAEVAVIGQPDPMLGEVPIAFVAPKECGAPSCDQMFARCREKLAHYKQPVAIHLLNELPKGPTGKILRRALRSELKVT